MAADRIYISVEVYKQLVAKYSSAPATLITDLLIKHNNDINRCAEELESRGFRQNYLQGGSSPRMDRGRGVGGATTVNTTRSFSTSATSGLGLPSSYGYPQTSPEQQQLYPQSAPVVPASKNFPFAEMRYHNAKPRSVSDGSGPQRPKPPVPPPTYLSHREHPNQVGHLQYGGSPEQQQQQSLYPSLTNDDLQVNVQTPPVIHKSSINIVPQMPCLPFGGGNPYGSPRPPPPYGWNPGTHSTSVNFQLGPPGALNNARQQVHISCGGGEDGGHTVRRSSFSNPTSDVPYESRLHISVNPNGGTLTAMRTQVHPGSSSPVSGPRYPSSLYPTADGGSLNIRPTYGPSSAVPSSSPNYQQPWGTNTTSPRTSPRFVEESFTSSLFDQEDPEQQRITQAPIRPYQSPVPVPNNPWNFQPRWPGPNGLDVGRNEVFGSEDYARALLAHQDRKYLILIQELDHEKNKLEDMRKVVVILESQYFKQNTSSAPLFFTFNDLQNLRAEIRSLMVDCQCMTRIVDLLHKGQVPLGETNEDFYKTINTGQQGPVLPVHSSKMIPNDPKLIAAWSRPAFPLPSPLDRSPQPPHQSHYQPSLPNSQQQHQRESSPQDDDYGDGQKWECCSCTFLNNAVMVRCEICDMPRFIEGEETHNFRIHVRQNPTCAAVSKALQLKLTHRLGTVRR